MDMVKEQMPVVVVVSGLPASGKSTLSRRLSADLGLPLLSRDALKPAMADLAEVAGPDGGWRVGRSIDLLIDHMARRLLDVGIGMVIDSNFNWPEQMDKVRALVEERRPTCFEVCLWADPSVLRQRFIDRSEPPLTPELEPHFAKALARERVPVLSPPTPIRHFDTSDFGALDQAYQDLLEEIPSIQGHA